MLATLLLLHGTAGSALGAPKENSESAPSEISRTEPIKIGLVLSLSGVGAEAAQEILNAIKLYFEQVHYKVAGRQIELVTENDGSSSDSAKDKFEQLAVKNHVDVIDGLLSSRIAHDVAPLADQFKIPTVLPIGAEDNLTQRKHSNYVVRVSWSASQTSQPFGEWVYKKLGYKKVAIFSVDYAYGWENAGGFQKSFEEAGGQVIQKLWAPLGLLDFSQIMKKIRGDADAVYLISTFGASDIMAKQYKQFGPGLPMIGSGSTFDDPILKHLGDTVIGAISSFSYCSGISTPANKRFVAAYEAKYKELPGLYTESGYVSAMWICKAIESLHGDVSDKEKFLAALKKVELRDAPRGPIKLDELSNPIENVYVEKVAKVNGKLQNIVIDTFPHVSQFWKWNQAEFLKQPVYSKTYPPCEHCSPDKSE
jgi:branched-chain amino acid transport system substrate-binding protein